MGRLRELLDNLHSTRATDDSARDIWTNEGGHDRAVPADDVRQPSPADPRPANPQAEARRRA